MGSRRGGDGPGWSTILVFVSSTFSDMQAERDALRDVFADLADRLRPHRRLLVPVDLRWGVDTVGLADEDEKEGRVLKVCLDEIERARPFFVGLLGERYGWVPGPERMARAARDAGVPTPPPGTSITELEFDVGVLSRPDQRGRSVILLRDPLDLTDVPDSVAARYCDARADDAGAAARAEAVAALRRRVVAEMGERAVAYPTRWDGERLGGLRDGFATAVRDRLWADLQARLAEEGDAVPVDEDDVEQSAFLAERLVVNVGRDGVVDDLVDRLVRPDPPDRSGSPWWWVPRRERTRAPRVTLLVAGPGIGKSTVAAAVVSRLTPVSPGAFVLLTHAAGAGARSASTDAMLGRWVRRLAEAAGERGEPVTPGALADDAALASADRRTLLAELRRLLRHPDVGPVRIVVDALDQLEGTVDGEQAAWLPEPLPAGVRVLLTTQPGPAADAVALRADSDRIELSGLDRDRLAELVASVAAHHRRSLNPEVVAALLDRGPDDGRDGDPPSPLWGRLAVDELLRLDEDDFARLASFEGATAEERLHRGLCRRAEEIPTAVPAVYDRQFAQVEAEFGRAAAAVVDLLATSRHGLRDHDLLGLVPAVSGESLADVDYARLRRSLRSTLVRRADGRLDFAHLQGRLAAERRTRGRVEGEAVADAAVARHRAVAHHLSALPVDDPVRRKELLHHLLAGGDAVAAASLLASDAGPDAVETVVASWSREEAATTRTLVAAVAGDVAGPTADVVVDVVLPAARGRVAAAALLEVAEAARATAWSHLERIDRSDPTRTVAEDVLADRYERAALAGATAAVDAGWTGHAIELLGAVVTAQLGRAVELPAPAAHRLAVASAALADALRTDGRFADAGRRIDEVERRVVASVRRDPTDALRVAAARLLLARAEVHVATTDLGALAAAAAAVDRAEDLLTGTDVGAPDRDEVVARLGLVATRLHRIQGDDNIALLQAVATAGHARAWSQAEPGRFEARRAVLLADGEEVAGHAAHTPDVVGAAARRFEKRRAALPSAAAADPQVVAGAGAVAEARVEAALAGDDPGAIEDHPDLRTRLAVARRVLDVIDAAPEMLSAGASSAVPGLAVVAAGLFAVIGILLEGAWSVAEWLVRRAEPSPDQARGVDVLGTAVGLVARALPWVGLISMLAAAVAWLWPRWRRAEVVVGLVGPVALGDRGSAGRAAGLVRVGGVLAAVAGVLVLALGVGLGWVERWLRDRVAEHAAYDPVVTPALLVGGAVVVVVGTAVAARHERSRQRRLHAAPPGALLALLDVTVDLDGSDPVASLRRRVAAAVGDGAGGAGQDTGSAGRPSTGGPSGREALARRLLDEVAAAELATRLGGPERAAALIAGGPGVAALDGGRVPTGADPEEPWRRRNVDARAAEVLLRSTLVDVAVGGAAALPAAVRGAAEAVEALPQPEGTPGRVEALADAFLHEIDREVPAAAVDDLAGRGEDLLCLVDRPDRRKVAAALRAGSGLAALYDAAERPSTAMAVRSRAAAVRARHVRQGDVLPSTYWSGRTTVSWAGGPATDAREAFRLRLARSSLGRGLDAVRTLGRYRVELLPVVGFAVAATLLAGAVFAAEVDRPETPGRVILVGGVAALAVLAGLAGLCWLTPRRREDAADRREDDGAEPRRFLRYAVHVDPGARLPRAAVDLLAGEDPRAARWADLHPTVPLTIRHLTPSESDRLAAGLTALGVAHSTRICWPPRLP
ncbi:MAG: DUF4062 domain-containing protein [Acidimicrobiales bacterium]|nr:DUF4062 domain-containing protein [Acidimicrobiales bacterium]